MRENVQIRPTEISDAPYLMQWLTEPDVLRWFPMCDAREIEDAARIWVGYAHIRAGLTAVCEGEPCGMANLYIQPYAKLAHTCLLAIIVKRECRGQGVGRLLLTHLIDLARSVFHIETLHLEVYEGNPAQHLYEHMGFVPFGRQSHFIKEEGKYSAKILMEKKLTDPEL